jgi:uncharacterized membrane protein
MQGKAKLLGHSLHPMLVAFPIGLLSLVWVFDIVHLSSGDGLWAQIAFYLLTCGLAGGVLAAVTGFIDWLSIPANTRAYRVGLTHLAVNLLAVAFFVLSWIFRLHVGVEELRAIPFVLSLIGFCTMLAGAWLGGELVEQHGMGVRRDANLNAPSSLDEERLIRRPAQTDGERPQPA